MKTKPVLSKLRPVAVAAACLIATVVIAAPAQARLPIQAVSPAWMDTPPTTDQPTTSRNMPASSAIMAGPCWYSSGWRCNNIVGAIVYDPADPVGKMFFNILATFAEKDARHPMTADTPTHRLPGSPRRP